ncbi:MAG: type II toxin-antitoxin system VapC family toxin [Saprospiraceae bacterium]|nr:type II toxin-antitoxin system VapC family toxin [Saprospiraceae bacterium]
MSGDYILDSNIVIDIFRNDSATISEVTKLNKIYVPVIVLGELHYGANKSSQTSKRTLEIDQLKRRVILLDVTDRTAKHYGEIKNKLHQKGKMIPENDIWIAAIAMETGLPLLSNDKHFQFVDGIVVDAI